jgi:hypothetical protein
VDGFLSDQHTLWAATPPTADGSVRMSFLAASANSQGSLPKIVASAYLDDIPAEL